MKKILLTLLLIPFSVSAQQYPGMDMNSQPDMKKMMATMQKMQACMQKIDKSEIRKMERESKAFQKDVQSLCAKGKRAQAQKKARKFGENMMNDSIAKELKKCTDIMLKNINPDTITEEGHICDSPENNFLQ